MKSAHRFGDAVPLSEHWKHKYLIDVDGMGYSARLFAFLMSESAVIKSTIYKEWFDGWIQPWSAQVIISRSEGLYHNRLHYIPLSSSYRELYNIHAYFSGPSEYMTRIANATYGDVKAGTLDADAQLRRIARAGRRWKQTIGRLEDMESAHLAILFEVILTTFQHTFIVSASNGLEFGLMTEMQ